METNYSTTSEYTGVLRERNGERTVPLINEEIHPENEVRVYQAWEHKTKNIIVLALTITQKGCGNINSVYVVQDGNPEEVKFGWSRIPNDAVLMTKKTKEDVIQDAKEWMMNNPNGS